MAVVMPDSGVLENCTKGATGCGRGFLYVAGAKLVRRFCSPGAKKPGAKKPGAKPAGEAAIARGEARGKVRVTTAKE